MTRNVLLSGVVGSTAYGLAKPGSDKDRLAVYAEPTIKFHGLRMPIDKAATKRDLSDEDNPDFVLHEARKYALLALQCNPTVMELMWLPKELYEERTKLGNQLIELRDCFLTAKRVKEAYLGYATQQFSRLEGRSKEGKPSFSSDTAKRTAKHARHLRRLCWQGYNLYAGNGLKIRVENPSEYHAFGEKVAAGDIKLAKAMLEEYEEKFRRTVSPLPASPDESKVEQWLLAVRKANLPSTWFGLRKVVTWKS